MKITIKHNKTEITYEANDPSQSPLAYYTGKNGITDYDISFTRLLELVKTMADKVIDMELKQTKP